MATNSAKPSGEDIWRRYDAIEQRLSAPLSERMMELGCLEPGMKVLDIATGRGEPAIPAAKRLLPDGFVLGLDSDSSMLRLAKERADREGVTNLEFAVSNFETLAEITEHKFDVALARWGLMYFHEPVKALRTVRNALVADGLLVAAVWNDPESATFFSLPRDALPVAFVAPIVDHDRPSTFYYSDLDRLAQDLEAAGFRVHHSERLWVDVMEVSTDDEIIAWGRSFGMWDLLSKMSAVEQRLWEKNLINMAEQYRTPEGSIKIGGSSLIVVAA